MQGKAVAQYPVPGEKPKYAGSKSGQGWSNRGIVRTSTSEIWAVLETKNPIQKGSCAVQETPLEEFNDYRNAMAMKATIQFLSNTTMNAPFFIAQVSVAACRRLFSPGWAVTPKAGAVCRRVSTGLTQDSDAFSICRAARLANPKRITVADSVPAPPGILFVLPSLPSRAQSCHLCGRGGHRYIYPKQFDQYYPNDTISYPPKTGWGIPKDIPVSATLRLGCQAALLTPLALCPGDGAA